MSTTDLAGTIPADTNRVGAIETRGIEPVPSTERTGGPGQLFWVWFAANISILGLPLGATLVALRGMNIWQALLVAAIGSFGSFALVGLISVAGKWGGAPSMTLSRAIFGPRGNHGPTVISWLSRVGWETVNTTTAAYALLALLDIAFGLTANPVLTVISLLAFVALTLVVSGLGHATLVWIQQWATYVFGALNIVVAAFLITRVDWHAVLDAPAAPLSVVIAGIGVIAAGTGIGWANAGADMARYQHRNVPGGRIVAAASAGAGIPLFLLIGLGGLLSAGDGTLASASDPVSAIQVMLPSWMAVPYLLAAFGGLLLSNNLSVYSAGLTMITLGIRTRRVVAVGLDIVLTLAGGIYFMLIAGNFYGPFITFISLLAVPITAWVAVFLADMLFRRDYDPRGLMDTTRTSAYWYHGGFRWSAVLPWLAGTVVGLLFLTASTSADDVWFSGPLADSWLGTNGLGWVAAFVVAGALYLLFGVRSARRSGTAGQRGDARPEADAEDRTAGTRR
ncbi:purine-cytosine permease family protein [Micromonospora avicenniae]|uniref:Purine-cytosine permease n=1 Tax=Micromonospora avicenniae TaxID=1198245 RepID=A0A1N6ZMR5_9ACTN|nr:cytosine permease [Micromonospora avicenniae]SIR28097.1 Purine-cytosine permease [Micromonospora avicenniae]